MSRRCLPLPLALGLLLIGLPARAQQGYVRAYEPNKNSPHLYLGVQGEGYATVGQSNGNQQGYLGSGGGAGLFVGGRLSPVASLEGTWDTTWHDENMQGAVDSFYLMSFGGALRLNIPTETPFEPYFRLGAGYSLIGANWRPGFDFDTVFAHGVDVVGGIGAEVYAGPYFSVGVQANYRGYWFDNPNVPAFAALNNNTNYVSVLGFGLSGTFHL